MESGEYLRKIILHHKGIKFKTYSELAAKACINQGNLSSFMKPQNSKGRRENLSFDTAWKILKFLGITLPTATEQIKYSHDYMIEPSGTIQRTGAYSPREEVIGDNLPVIPVHGNVGAGDAVEFFTAQAEFMLPVLPAYYRASIIGLVVDGDSMEPTIHKGAIVGVIPFDGSITEGAIYIVRRPPFGCVMKRIRMSEQNLLELHSDNPAYKPITIEPDGYENLIAGRVVWLWQTC